jgi:trk system potassium uptake protein TrkA
MTLARLGESFRGKKVKGIGFDKDVLLEAGIEQADAFAATSASDNANVVAARIARNIFFVPRVRARPRKADIYKRLGLLPSHPPPGEPSASTSCSPTLSWSRSDLRQRDVSRFGGDAGHAGRENGRHLSVSGSGDRHTRQGQALSAVRGTEFQPGDTIHQAILAIVHRSLQDPFWGWTQEDKRCL